jgi:hypothetical protein
VKRLEDMDEPELRTLMNVTCHGIEASAEVCGVERPLFVVVLFNDPKIAQYASNANRRRCGRRPTGWRGGRT